LFDPVKTLRDLGQIQFSLQQISNKLIKT